jgi:hypothetical protein
MPHLVDKRIPVPFSCDQCAHYIEGCKCKAFDIIPIEIYCSAEEHSQKMKGQKGDYVFEVKEGVERPYDNVYVME